MTIFDISEPTISSQIPQKCPTIAVEETLNVDMVSSVIPQSFRRLLGNRQAHKFIAGFAALAVIFLLVQVILLSTWGKEKKIRGIHVNTEKSLKVSPVVPRGRKPSLESIAGVEKSKRHHYQPNSEENFACLDSNEEISFDFVNDDFCDCKDGSDEPSTGACINSSFHCTVESVTNRRQIIESSRVNDGICDCCDGSDEWKAVELPTDVRLSDEVQKKLSRYLVPCPYFCW